MNQYENLLRMVLSKGARKSDRTGTDTISSFGCTLRYDLSEGFPVITTKKIHLKSIIFELLWFLKGDTNISYLNANGISIWDEWADANGELGPIYGYQWRSWPIGNGEHIDQIKTAIHLIKTNPDSRRIIVSAWNVADLSKMALPPCHLLFQFYVCNGKLSCLMFQRSADLFLGLPFNISSYALLLMMIAQVCNLQSGELIISLGDCHIYLNHIEQVKLQLSREPRCFPTMNIDPSIKDISKFEYDHFSLNGYDPYPPIKAPIAV